MVDHASNAWHWAQQQLAFCFCDHAQLSNDSGR
jgi:hypothetical protein